MVEMVGGPIDPRCRILPTPQIVINPPSPPSLALPDYAALLLYDKRWVKFRRKLRPISSLLTFFC